MLDKSSDPANSRATLGRLAVLPFPSIVVASNDDAFVTLDRAKEFAESWGSRFVFIGAAGHFNSASGLGPWTKGKELLADLLQQPDGET
ncbi:MAG: alpha/beta hydrolase [Pyrinomonadaceae bacterium]